MSETSLDLRTFVGLTGLVTPGDTITGLSQFHGKCIGVKNGFLRVQDADKDVYLIEPGQFTLDPPNQIVRINPFPVLDPTPAPAYQQAKLLIDEMLAKSTVVEEIHPGGCSKNIVEGCYVGDFYIHPNSNVSYRLDSVHDGVAYLIRNEIVPVAWLKERWRHAGNM